MQAPEPAVQLPLPFLPTFVAYRRLDERAVAPEFQTPGAAGFDLSIIEDVAVEADETFMARTGLVIRAPVGHMLMLAPRSSTWARWGIRLGNTVGIVDEDFCGNDDELFLALWNPNYTVRKVPAGTRVAQGIFVPISQVIFEEHASMPDPSRGGWGSTGA